MKRTPTVLVVCGLLIAGIVTATGFWLTSVARRSMVEQVIRGETTAAVERAAQIDSGISAARERLSVTAAMPGASVAIGQENTALLGAALANAARGQGLTRLSVTAGTRVLASVPAGEPPVVVPDDRVRATSTRDHLDARVAFSTPVRDRGGRAIGRLHAELSITELVPQFTQPFVEDQGRSGLVARDGTMLISSDSTSLARLRAPTLLALARSGETKGVSYRSTVLGTDRIASAAPVSGYPWVVIVAADASAAGGPATALVARLALGIVVSVALATGVLVVASVVVIRSRRALRDAHATARDQAVEDPLTGIPNRRAFEVAVNRARRSDEQVGIVLVDLDDLKGLNDTYGHAIGDEAIRRAAHAVSTAVRPTDRVARIGGDEFAVVLSAVSLAQVERLAARIRTAIDEERVLEGIPLRASVGCASGAGRAVDDVVAQADARMYAIKRARRAATIA